jgi:hypothetical protein
MVLNQKNILLQTTSVSTGIAFQKAPGNMILQNCCLPFWDEKLFA